MDEKRFGHDRVRTGVSVAQGGPHRGGATCSSGVKSKVTVFESRHQPGMVEKVKDSFSKLCLVIAGHTRWECGGRHYLVGPDTVCHIPAGQEHAQETPLGTPVVMYTVCYDPELLPTPVRRQLFALGIVVIELGSASLSHGQLIRTILQEMLFEQESRQEGWEVILQSRLLELAIRVVRLARRRGRTEVPRFALRLDSADRVARYALWLRSHFTEQQTLVEAARSVSLSRRQFTELFRKVTGQSWRRMVVNLRLQHAAALLAETDRAVSEVAFESGFQDLSNFHHCFKAAYGCSPLVYRAQRRVRLESVDNPVVPSKSQSNPGIRFTFRGLKGWFWTPEQYLAEIPVLPQLKLNFLMNCYGSMFLGRPGEPWCNKWWEPLSAERRAAWERIWDECTRFGLTFCLAIHPQMASPRPLRLGDTEDLAALCRHYLWALGRGITWFSLCLDGTIWGAEGPSKLGVQHALLTNAVLQRLWSEGEAELILCPAVCWGDGTNPEHKAYLEALGNELHPAVRVFWNGDSIVTPRVTRVAAESFQALVRHRLFLWDNYPVNDGSPTLHLGPLRGREAGLCELVDGYICNAMSSQNEISRLPVATCADYAFAPQSYNPVRSISRAITWLGRTRAQREVLTDLVEAYPGFIVVGGGTGTNPVRTRFASLLSGLDGVRAARQFLAQHEELLGRFAKAFPNHFSTALQVLAEDAQWMRQQLAIQT